jgi:hypothetical protein
MVVCISLGHNGFLLKNNRSHEILIQGIVHKPTYIRTIPCSLLKAIPTGQTGLNYTIVNPTVSTFSI